MALTVQQILDRSTYDIRKVLNNTGTDATNQIQWVDRIHKDALHTGIYNYLTLLSTNIATVVGTGSYNLPATIRYIINVYDRTKDRMLYPVEAASYPVAQYKSDVAGEAEKVEGHAGRYMLPLISDADLQGSEPKFFKHIGNNGGTQQLFVYPTPQQVRTLEITYEIGVTTLVALTDTLLIPEDGVDIVVAGVDYLATMFLKREQEAQFWFQLYGKLKKGEA